MESGKNYHTTNYKKDNMRIDIITVLPEIIQPYLNQSILKRAQNKGKVSIYVHNLRDYAPKKQVDDYQYGGGAGMVIKVEPISKIIEKLKSERTYDEIIYLTPDGETFNQQIANQLSLKNNLILIAGHYKGIDERARQLYVTRSLSIGDYVLTGGELPALIVVDAVVRLIPGVLSDATSALEDSFQDYLLAPPVYTRPREFKGLKVPDILLSGNNKKIKEWRLLKAIEKTKKIRPDLYNKYKKLFGE